MRHKALSALVGSLLALALSLPAFAQGGGDQVIATYTFGQVPLATLQNTVIPGSIGNDRGFLLGGIGSDMWRAPTDPAGEYFLVTDRGPNGQIRVEGKNRRTFPVPEFTPIILRVRLDAPGQITVLQALPIVGQSGRPITGLSNQARDEVPYDYAAQARFELNPSGLDTEGLVRAPDGTFWLDDEYSPSLIHIDATGKVIKRYVPRGLALTGADYPVAESLPALYEKRRQNRGFEGLALSPDGRTLFLILQSPLRNPDAATGDPSRSTRILAFDIASEQPVGEYVYSFDPFAEFDPESPTADEMKLSAAVALSASRLLILERTDRVAKIYEVDLGAATNILGGKWDDPATAPSLEAQADLAAAGVKPLPKTLVVNLDTLPAMPDKIEGFAVVDASTIAVVNDNDFDINNATFDAAGNVKAPGVPSQVLLVRLGAPLSATPAPLPVALPNTGGAESLWLVVALLGLSLAGAGLAMRRRAA